MINSQPPSVPAHKLVVAAAGISDAGAGKVKFKITNNSIDSVMIKNLSISSIVTSYRGSIITDSERISTYSTGTVILYKGEVASDSERISVMGASVTSGSTITVDQQATKLEILAGQTVTIFADLDGTAVGDSNIVNASINDIAYFEKIQGAYSNTAITSIKSYNGTGLPATNSFSRSAGTY